MLPVQLNVLQVQENIDAALSDNTIRAYRSDWKAFTDWCHENDLTSLPATPMTVSAYISISALAGKSASTINRSLASIRLAHQLKDLPSPTDDRKVKIVHRGIRRRIGVQQHPKRALLVDDVKKVCVAIPDSLAGLRDMAIILVGFAAALRRSELVALNVEDIEFNNDGMIIAIRSSKTDQEGEGDRVAIPFAKNFCPVRTLQTWLQKSGITNGAIFVSVSRNGKLNSRLSATAIARIVKYRVEEAGLDPTQYAGHSLRRGLATSAARVKADHLKIQRHGRWHSSETVNRYIEEGELFNENVLDNIGL